MPRCSAKTKAGKQCRKAGSWDDTANEWRCNVHNLKDVPMLDKTSQESKDFVKKMWTAIASDSKLLVDWVKKYSIPAVIRYTIPKLQVVVGLMCQMDKLIAITVYNKTLDKHDGFTIRFPFSQLKDKKTAIQENLYPLSKEMRGLSFSADLVKTIKEDGDDGNSVHIFTNVESTLKNEYVWKEMYEKALERPHNKWFSKNAYFADTINKAKPWKPLKP